MGDRAEQSRARERERERAQIGGERGGQGGRSDTMQHEGEKRKPKPFQAVARKKQEGRKATQKVQHHENSTRLAGPLSAGEVNLTLSKGDQKKKRRDKGSANGSGSSRSGRAAPTSSSLREMEATPILSWYWMFWHSGLYSGGKSSWEVFVDGSQFRHFKEATSNEKSSSKLKEKPGVYEFSLVHPSSTKKRFKVYAGHTNNMLRRHHRDYRSNGSHLLKQFSSALQEGYIVMRRVKYTESAEKAKAVESKLLKHYNYAWNAMENGSKRDVHLKPNFCCCLCCKFQVSVQVES